MFDRFFGVFEKGFGVMSLVHGYLHSIDIGGVDMKDPKVVFVDDMVARFAERALSIQKNDRMPPLEGAMRKKWIDQRNIDFQDYKMLSEAEGSLDDGILCLRIDLNGEG